jgi:hypothetical protein
MIIIGEMTQFSYFVSRAIIQALTMENKKKQRRKNETLRDDYFFFSQIHEMGRMNRNRDTY